MNDRNTDRKHQLLFVQGGGEGTHDDWDAKLVASLQQQLGPSWDILYPRLPREDDPSYARWKPALVSALGTLGTGAMLVAHSVGATVLVKVLSEQSSSLAPGGLFLIAPPFVGEGGWPSDELQLPRDLGARLPPDAPIHVFHGTLDREVPASHLKLYAQAIPRARIHRLPGRDHQLNNDLREVAEAIVAASLH